MIRRDRVTPLIYKRQRYAYLHLLIIFVSFPQSNYGAGLRILHVDTEDLDVHEVAYFDVLPTSQPTPTFEGTWSNYPYFASGQNN